jgi:DNA mismatch endonuclease (patch repair protein)
MSSIKGSNTSPEKIVRLSLRRLGCKFSTYCNALPGNPDIILRKNKKVIFVHGCFWHNHRNCKRAALPKTNKSFWEKKIKGNARRDQSIKRKLWKLGWRVLTIWQCQIRDSDSLTRKLDLFIRKGRSHGRKR